MSSLESATVGISPHTHGHALPVRIALPPWLPITAALTISRPYGLQPGSWFPVPLTHPGGHDAFSLSPCFCSCPTSAHLHTAARVNLQSDHLSLLMNSLQWLLNRLKKKKILEGPCLHRRPFLAPAYPMLPTLSLHSVPSVWEVLSRIPAWLPLSHPWCLSSVCIP